MELLVVANPVSGGGRAGRAAAELADRLDERRHAVELLLTTRAGHATERLERGPTPECVVSVGGDGTINEIANGVLAAGGDHADHPAARRPTIAVLAAGTANVLARELNLPTDSDRVVRSIERGNARLLDVGHVRSIESHGGRPRHFVCMASAGFDGLVTRLVAERRRGTQGFAAYAAPIGRALTGYRPSSLRVIVDDGEPLAGGWVLVSLVRNYAGVFTMAELARPGAGRFEVLVLRDASRLDVARLALSALRGGGSSLRGVRRVTGVRVRVEAGTSGAALAADSVGADVQVDGDWIGRTPVEIELRPAAIRVIVPD